MSATGRGILPRASIDAMERLLLAMLGGALGTGARFLIGSWTSSPEPERFPWGTFAVNVLGSFAMGAVTFLAVRGDGWSDNARTFLAVGVLGGFTTYSSFNQESLTLVSGNAWGAGLAYVAATLVACGVAGVAGLALARACAGG